MASILQNGCVRCADYGVGPQRGGFRAADPCDERCFKCRCKRDQRRVAACWCRERPAAGCVAELRPDTRAKRATAR